MKRCTSACNKQFIMVDIPGGRVSSPRVAHIRKEYLHKITFNTTGVVLPQARPTGLRTRMPLIVIVFGVDNRTADDGRLPF